jgi:ABC-type multidrug transport system fused ATPase/permease subunit
MEIYSQFRQIFSLLNSTQKRNAYKLAFFILTGMFLEMIGIGVVIPVITLISDKDIGKTYPFLVPYLSALGNPSHEQICIYAVTALVLVYIIRSVLINYVVKWESKFIFGLQEYFSNKLFRTYMHRPYSFHLMRNSAELIHNILTEVNILVFKVVNPAIKLVSEFILLCVISIFLLMVEPVGALSVMILLATTGYLIHRKTKDRISIWGKKRKFFEAEVSKDLHQGLGGVKDTIILGREENFINLFNENNKNRTYIGQNQNSLSQLPRTWIELIAVFSFAVIVWIIVLQGKPLNTIIPTLGLFAVATFRLMPSVNRFLVSIQSIRFGLPVVKFLKAEYDLLEVNLSNEKKTPHFTNEIFINKLSFTYPSSTNESLKGVSLRINSFESVGLIGESGSGKSTLVDCILGLFEPQNGQILVDGKNIQEDLRGWQKQIGYVSQSIYLCDDTLRKNIAFGIPANQINEEAVLRAIKMAQLDNFIKTLPLGLDTIVGERGVRLSGGQRQRIGIARALYNDPAILILDEATSALDIATENEVMKSVFDLAKQKTLIIIAHRLSTVANCQKIFHMKNGEIIEEGRPEDIITKLESSLN